MAFLGMAGTFFLGRFVTSPSQKALQEAPSSIQAYAAVDQRTVSVSHRVKGTLVRGETHKVGGDEESNTGIVTGAPLGPGHRVTPMEYLGAIDGVPRFSMSASVPLYRDLKLGDQGNDVFHLQGFLAANGFPGVVPTATVDAVTLEAVRLIYTNQGLNAPGSNEKDTVFRVKEFLRFGDGTGRVDSAAPLASRVGKDAPLVTITSGQLHVTAHATLPAADSLTVGAKVGLKVGSHTGTGTVTQRGEFTKDGNGVQGRSVTVAPDGQLPAQETTLATIIPNNAEKPGPAIPLIALREENGQTYVLAAASKDAAPTKISVTVLRQADGWAAIKPVRELPVGAVLWLP